MNRRHFIAAAAATGALAATSRASEPWRPSQRYPDPRVEVIDPRTLVPLDKEAILNAVGRTGRLVIADPAHRTCGAAAEISAIVAEEAFDSLKAPIIRVTTPDTQIPFSPALEAQLYPNAVSIAEAVRKVIQ